MVKEIDVSFALLQGAIDGVNKDIPFTSHLSPLTSKDWWSLFRLMQQNPVAAMTADTMAALDVPREVKIPWLAERDKAARWHRYQREVQQEIVDTMKRHEIETLVLKGTNTAQYYPVPELREFGDLDLYFYDRHGEADRVAHEELKAAVGNDAHHHSKYDYRGITIESHYDFVNTHYPPSNRRYETLLKELCPSPTFEVLFLLRHMAGHFAAARITLRDLVDWTLTCRALHDKVDWGKVQDTVSEYGMEDFAAAIGDIAEQRFSISTPLRFTHDSVAVEKVEHDIVFGSVDNSTADGINRLLWKLRRWRSLAWKRRMVYNDSPTELWLASLTSHTMKPQSILHKQ